MSASPPPQTRSYELTRQGNYLGAVRVCQQAEGWENESVRLQLLSWALGAVGRYQDSQWAFNQAMRRRELPAPSQEELKAMEQVPLKAAEQVVLRATKEHQIVILNEAHHQPEHRFFGTRLVPRLKALGVKYFALETGSQASLDEGMKTRRVNPQTGSYTFEPQRAELLRAVLRAGMKLVAIDFTTPEEREEVQRDPRRGIPVREAAMARNIDEQILRRDPAAKILIWVGFSHACKRPQGGQEWMALRLWQRIGIEPFSIYQMSDAGDPGYDEPVYRLLAKSAGRRFREPKAVSLPAAGFAEELPEALRQHPVYSHLIARGVDAVILHPAEPFETATKRPAWLRPEGAADIRGTVLQDAAPREGYLVQALVEAEGNESTPVDQVLTDHRGRYHLRVRPERYRLRVWAPAGNAGDDHVVATLPAITCDAHQVACRVVRL